MDKMIDTKLKNTAQILKMIRIKEFFFLIYKRPIWIIKAVTGKKISLYKIMVKNERIKKITPGIIS